jgi:ankyrin repeat protein
MPVFDGDGTPLIAASRRGHIEMVSLLLEGGAKPNLGVGGDGNRCRTRPSKVVAKSSYCFSIAVPISMPVSRAMGMR